MEGLSANAAAARESDRANDVARQPLILASSSPRRRELLAAAGFDALALKPGVDDGALQRGGVAPRHWAAALAYLKVRHVQLHHDAGRDGRSRILAADTVCVVDGKILGQPRDLDHARAMLHLMRARDHQTISGVCILDPPGRRTLLVDAATVRIGPLSDEAVERYLASGDWAGKAGAYNLSDRIAAGWPIECIGDPATVMGLPMMRLAPLLDRRDD